MFRQASTPDLARQTVTVTAIVLAMVVGLLTLYVGSSAVFILFAHLVLHVGWIFGLVLAGWALRYLHGKKGRAQMAALAETLDRNGAFQALKPN